MSKAKGKDKKAKKGKGKAAGTASDGVIRLADHPRATRQIRKMRALGGIAGLVLGAYAAHGGGLPPFDVGVRALIGGIAGSLIAWSVAVVAWRHLVIAELRAAQLRVNAAHKALQAEIAERVAQS